MDFLEKDLEEIISNADRNDLRERGLNLTGKLFRQLRIGNYGVADLVTVEKQYKTTDFADIDNCRDPFLLVTVYELKKEKIGISSFLQAVRYAKGILRYINKRKPFIDVMIRVVLIGKKIDLNSSFVYLPDLLNLYYNDYSTCDIVFLENYIYSYDLKGINFRGQNNYKLKKEGF